MYSTIKKSKEEIEEIKEEIIRSLKQIEENRRDSGYGSVKMFSPIQTMHHNYQTAILLFRTSFFT